MQSSTCSFAFLLAAVAAGSSAAFNPSVSREAFLSRAASAATGALVAGGALASDPLPASAAEKPSKSKRPAFRGGKESLDALHNGTDLNKGEAAVAGGLLEKMGLNDISPDKGPSPKRR